MNTARDLFLSEEKKDQKARKSVAEIIAEDDADLKRLRDLAQTTIFHKKLSMLKSSCAWCMLHKRATIIAFSAATLVIAATVMATNLVGDEASVMAAAEDREIEPEAKEKFVPELKLPELAETEEPVNETKTDALQTYPSSDSAEKEQAQPNRDISLAQPQVLPPVAEVQVGEHLDRTTPKIGVGPSIIVGTITVPVNRVTIHEDTHTAPEEEKSASDFIDQFGFGSLPKVEAPATTTDDADMIEEDITPDEVVPVPAAKPQQDTPAPLAEIKDIRYQIVDRDGEKAGFRRMRDKNPDTTQWFLVVEAIDSRGNAIPMPVMSMDTDEVKVVTKWAMQVSEKDFMKFSDEKKITGKIANPIIGTAPSNRTEPKWSVKLTGNMLTEWE